MRRIIVKIDREKALELEKINYELGFTKDIIQRLIEAHPNDPDLINGDTLKIYHKQGAELQAAYSIAAGEMERLYIPKYLDGHKYTWNIPANSDEMIIDVHCNCEIEGMDEVE